MKFSQKKVCMLLRTLERKVMQEYLLQPPKKKFYLILVWMVYHYLHPRFHTISLHVCARNMHKLVDNHLQNRKMPNFVNEGVDVWLEFVLGLIKLEFIIYLPKLKARNSSKMAFILHFGLNLKLAIVVGLEFKVARHNFGLGFLASSKSLGPKLCVVCSLKSRVGPAHLPDHLAFGHQRSWPMARPWCFSTFFYHVVAFWPS